LLQLQELNLRANQFRKVPDCVSRLPALHTLGLGENAGLDVVDACRQLAGVPTLRHLSLFMNGLTELPDEIGLLTQLTSLDLSWNKLTGLPTSLARLTNLERLSLDHNPDLTALSNQQQKLLPQLD
jgi:Leucine-rich repeat (LRR) protein